jgi:putative hydrolase of HD superfamily
MLKTMSHTNLQKIIEFLKIAGILKKTERTGWLEVGVYQPESVADHTFRTVLLCLLYADIEALDTLKLVKMGLIHDLPEAVIGDLLPSQKNAESKEKEENAISQILNLLPKKQRENYLAVWNEYKKGKTREAKAVRQLDKIEMALQAKEYEKLGMGTENLNRFIKSAEEATYWPELKRLLSCALEEI